MPIPVDIPEIISIAKNCQFLSSNAKAKSLIFSINVLVPNFTNILRMVRRAVEWKYNGSLITTVVTPEVRATANYNMFSLSLTVGRELTIQVDDPILGFVILGSYTITSGDTTTVILTTHVKAAIANNIYGYSIGGDSTDIVTSAPVGQGSSTNGKSFLITWSGGSSSTTFSGGVDGVSITEINPADVDTLTKTSDYLIALCYNSSLARNASSSGACISPTILVNPQSQTVIFGETAIFVVIATGTNLTYQWQFNESNISGANSSSYSIEEVDDDNAGGYRCIISNGCGTATSTEATLTIGASSVSGSYYYGDTNYYTALAAGTDAITYQGTFSITDGADFIVPYPIAANYNKYLVIRVPRAQSLKTVWNNLGFNFGAIPSINYYSPLQPSGLAAYTYYVSRTAQSNNFTSPLILTN